jgi:hypothetical protein
MMRLRDADFKWTILYLVQAAAYPPPAAVHYARQARDATS